MQQQVGSILSEVLAVSSGATFISTSMVLPVESKEATGTRSRPSTRKIAIFVSQAIFASATKLMICSVEQNSS